VKVAGESKAKAASGGGDMFWTKNAAMTNEKMNEKRSALWQAWFQKCKWILEVTVGEERQPMTVAPLILMFPEMRAGNPSERQHLAKDFQFRRHRTDTG
jgi:hypothetical protein